MYLNREEGSAKGKASSFGEHPGRVKVLSAPLTRFHLSEVTFEPSCCSAAPAPPPCVRAKCELSLCNTRALNCLSDRWSSSRLCFYSKLHRRRLIVNLLEETKPLRHLRAWAGARAMFCVSADACLRETRHKVKALSHDGKPSSFGVFGAFTAGDGVREGVREGVRLQLRGGRKASSG